jgi:16S rRNA C1402 N4-methylase RsmH
VTKKALIPNEEEINENSRARSAKLRIAEKY